MSLTPATKLGPYEILAPLGAGGMGEVYRARDTKLGREVAIKVLPETFSQDEARLARFEREARLLASLNHPNIATLYGLEQSDNVQFLVMELVAGETLGERIQQGPIPVDEALPLFKQIAEGLEAAHEKGVVHRDLKPANIKITPDGKAKVLDFGLAKAFAGDETQVSDLSRSPTVTREGTETGVLLGTPPYMSPEQARGKAVDKRADIWAFGCCLYGALTGKAAFLGETVSDTIARIIQSEPDWESLPDRMPSKLKDLLARCLKKDVHHRLHDIADARLEIDETLSEPGTEPVGTGLPATAAVLWRWAAALVLACLLVGALVGRGLLPSPGSPPLGPITHLLLGVEPGLRLSGGHAREERHWALQRPSRTAMAISPDGRTVVYSATDGLQRRLYLRTLDQPRAVPIQGTENGASPFFSPDGLWVGFSLTDDPIEAAEPTYDLKKVGIRGGEPRTILADGAGWAPTGATWGPHDSVVFSDGDRLFRVPAAGGTKKLIAEPDPGRGEHRLVLPHFLPGGEALVYTAHRGPTWMESDIVARPLTEGGEPKVLIEGGADARYVPSGHLVFGREGTLMAVAFDPARLEIEGEPVPFVEDVMQAQYAGHRDISTGAAQFCISASGCLLYAMGGVTPESIPFLDLVDPQGGAERLPFTGEGPRVSPHGRRLLALVTKGNQLDLWVYDLERGTSRPFLWPGNEGFAAWSPDGTRIVFSSNPEGGAHNLYVRAADGSGEPVRLTTTDGLQTAASWSRDDVLAFVEAGDIWILEMDGDGNGEPRPFLATTAKESHPTFSPDGKWLAYTSDQTERMEVYLRPYPGPDPEIRVSIDGGYSPAWSRDGHALFYRTGEKYFEMMMVVDIQPGDVLDPRRPRLLFEKEGYVVTMPVRSYDVTPEGKFVMVGQPTPEPQPVTEIHVVLNWHEELKRLVPTDK